MKFASKFALIARVLLVTVITSTACVGGPEPEDRVFGLDIKPSLDPVVIKVNQDDTVTLNIDADDYGLFHLHGYDTEVEVGPDETTTIGINADATGQFKITFHPRGSEEHTEEGHDAHEEGEERTVGSFHVQPR